MCNWFKKLFGLGKKDEQPVQPEMPEQAAEPQAEEGTEEEQRQM